MSALPSPAEAVKILKDEGCTDNVIIHCIAVSKLAFEIAEKFKKKGISINIDLIVIGSILHDIGRSKTHGVEHGVTGGELAKSYNLPKSVIKIIERHVGSGITAQEAQALGLPKIGLIPKSYEEKIVCYADKLIEKGHRMNFFEALNKFSEDLGKDHPAIIRFKKISEELQKIVGSAILGLKIN